MRNLGTYYANTAKTIHTAPSLMSRYRNATSKPEKTDDELIALFGPN